MNDHRRSVKRKLKVIGVAVLLLGVVNLTHPTTAQQFDDAVVAKMIALRQLVVAWRGVVSC